MGGTLVSMVLAEKVESSGLSFLPTPGPGDSEGGEIYAPKIKVKGDEAGSARNDATGAD